jgi:predicted nuclease of predicted toxin-antitoxin system
VSELRFYLDENVPTEIARQLFLSGIDAISVRDLGLLGHPDCDHLQRATELGRVLCTHDQDFLRLAAEEVEHAGIAFAQQDRASIREWVRALRALHARCDSERARNQVFFLSL